MPPTPHEEDVSVLKKNFTHYMYGRGTGMVEFGVFWGVSMDPMTVLLTDQIRKRVNRFTNSFVSRCRLTHGIWYPTRCSAAHKELPVHGIKVRSKPEFDV